MQPLAYLQTTDGLVFTLACLPMGFLLIFIAYFLFNKFPAKWYCDYDEEPSAELLSSRRISYKGSGIALSVIAAVCFAICRLQYNKGFDIIFFSLCIAIVVLLMISVSDFKYTIIPDQFTAFLAIIFLAIAVYDICRGYHIFNTAWWTPILGAAIGGGSMLLINTLGMFIYKKEGMGFGDVKLFAAIGILTGFPGTLYTLFIALIVACVGFVFTIIKVRSNASYDEVNESDSDSTSVEEPNPTEQAEKVTEENSNLEISENDAEQDTAEEENTRGSYLAFGPYIAIAAIAYICLFDYINQITTWYLGLF